MSGRVPPSLALAILLPLLALAFLAGGAGLGYWLVHRAPGSSPDAASTPEGATTGPETLAGENAQAASWKAAAWLSALPGANMEALALQAQLAKEAGIDGIILAAALPYPSQPERLESLEAACRMLTETHPQCRLRLQIHVDPPALWLAEHPGEAACPAGEPAGWVSLSSREWRQAMQQALGGLARRLEEEAYPIEGYILAALEQGQWRCVGAPDASPPALQAFGSWLEAQYANTAALQQAWDNPNASFSVSEWTHPGEGGVFFTAPQEQRHVDFRRFAASEAAAAIVEAASAVRQTVSRPCKVYTLTGEPPQEPVWPAFVDWAALLDGGLDGVAAPAPVQGRGAGESGGPVGPIDSVTARGMAWLLIDDTRTGIRLDPGTNGTPQPPGLRNREVYHVQARNYAMAMAHGSEFALADAQGQGALLDAAMWERLALLASAYEHLGEMAAPRDVLPAIGPSRVACVVDETSQAFVHRFPAAGPRMAELRTALAQAGTPVHWVLFDDLIAGRVDAASLYVFPALYEVSDEERAALHALLAQQGAAALWLYAPGSAGSGGGAGGIAALTRLPVAAFEGPAQSGSEYAFEAERYSEGEAFGRPAAWDPLYYIDGGEDDEIGVLARYGASGRPSAGIRFLEEGWASIYVAEPALPPELLLQVMRILEETTTVSAETTPFPVSYVGPSLIGLHGNAPGDRRVLIQLAAPCDMYDLLDEHAGWLGKRQLSLPLALGETRLLRLEPVDSEEAESAEEPQAGASAETGPPDDPPEPPADAQTETTGKDEASPTASNAEGP